MSAGHRHGAGPVTRKREQEIERLLDDDKFRAAVAAYRKEDDKHDVPFLGGSNENGDTVYFDRHLPATVSVGDQEIDPRVFVGIHEKVEGALIRLYGWDYDRAHDFATYAERLAVEHSGLDWDKYEAALKPLIKADEHEHVSNPAADLLTLPYQHTPQDKEVEPMAKKYEGSASDRRMDQTAVRRSPGGYVPNFSQEFTAVQDQRKAKRMFSPGGEERYKRMRDSPGGYVPNPEQSVAAKQAAATHPRMHALAIGAANLLHPMGHITGGQKARITAKSRNALNLAKKAKAGPPAAPMFGSLAPAMPEPGVGGAGPGMGSPIV